ncbi:helix-turn-helix transcriptional regulator [Flavobacterium sp. DG2-3]|nr:helix-turn-helix transcriptional regulator [Flavobacterium sp. DG2-3]MDP5201738.1 helix-turn-helix transcriptional regulator [Flavobacterium sp. DG2-3]
MKMKNNAESNITSLDQFKDKHYGKIGSKKRDTLEKGYESFKIGALLLEARLQKGMTQEQLAEKTGTTKSYISKIENNVKEVRFSTLQKIVEIGLGGQLELSIKI